MVSVCIVVIVVVFLIFLNHAFLGVEVCLEVLRCVFWDPWLVGFALGFLGFVEGFFQ